MSTRSCVGRAGDDRGGRYIHSDGYPSWVGVKLVELVRRDGADIVLDVMTEQHYGWSSLDPECAELYSFQQDGRFELVENYGVAYTTVMDQSSPEDWVTPETRWGTVFQYYISDDGTIDVLYDWEPLFSVNAFDDDAVRIMVENDPYND